MQDGAIQFELDDGLHLGNCLQLALDVGLAVLLLGDVRGVFDDLEGLAVAVEDGVVAGLQPDLVPVLGDAAVAAGIVLALSQPLPERSVLCAVARGLIYKHAVVLALDFRQRVAGGLQEVVIGMPHMALQVELDHSLHGLDGGQLALLVCGFAGVAIEQVFPIKVRHGRALCGERQETIVCAVKNDVAHVSVCDW